GHRTDQDRLAEWGMNSPVIGCYRGFVAVKTGGVYLTFDGGPDGSSGDGPGIGPYDEIVLRGARAVGERGGLGKVIALRSSAGSWRDAESSSAESDAVDGGPGDLRISAADGDVGVRFSADEGAGASAPSPSAREHASSGEAAPSAADDDAGPSVWVDRVKAAPDIYISRPDRKR